MGTYVNGYVYNIAGGVSSDKIVEATENWLEENVKPESGYAIDKTLSIENAAADAKKTGNEINGLKSTKAPVIIDSASGAIASFPDGADSMPLKALTVNIEPVQSGSGDPSPTNVRPISGWTGANVTRTGKNLFDMSKMTATSALDVNVNADGSLTVITGSYEVSANQLMTGTLPAGTYTVKNYSTERTLYVQIGSDSDYSHSAPRGGGVLTFTYDGTSHLRFMFSDQPANTTSTYKAQLELGSTATAYEPYQGNTYTIQLGDTVYGGTLDVTSGVLTVNKAMKVFIGESSEGWSKTDYGYFLSSRISDAINRNATPSDFQSNLYPYGIIANNNQMLGACLIWGFVRVRLADMSISLDDWKSQLASTPMQVVYLLATPIEITLTPTQIDTLLGTNNIWADCGDIEVEYRADTKLYIQKINAPADDDMTADAQIASGKYFIIGNNLYLSTTTIPAGDTIIPGTNCTKTNLAEALNALNA